MNAIVVRTDKKILYTRWTLPVIKQFSKKWDAKIILLEEGETFLTDDNLPHYRILRIKEFAHMYDRILLLDADVLITPHCLNPFEEVPEEAIGTIFEDVGSRLPHRRGLIHKVQFLFGDVNWVMHYTNAGVFVFSPKLHMRLFEPFEDGSYWTGFGSVDVQMGYNIAKYKMRLHELSFKWNHMSMYEEEWNNYASRFDSYIIHYAGGARFPDLGTRSKEQIIADDYKRLYA